MNKKKFTLALLAFILPTLAMASTSSTVPTIVADYGNIITHIITGVVVSLVIIIMIVFAGWEMYKNGNATPLKWAIFASIVIGGAVYFGPQIISYMEHTVGSGGSAVTTVS